MSPPRIARWLLKCALPAGLKRDSILGDLREDFAQREQERGRTYAGGWYLRQAVGIAWSMGTRRLLTTASETVATGRIMLLDTLGHAFKSVFRAPAFTLTTTMVLAFGIGATTAVFTLVDAVLLRPLPYPDSESLMTLTSVRPDRELARLSEPEYLDVSRDVDGFSSVTAYSRADLAVGSGPEPRRVPVINITASAEHVFGIPPAHGRWFSGEEDSPAGDRVTVLGHGLAQELFGRARDAVGGQVVLEDQTHAIVGVMPPGFSFGAESVDAWTPLRLDPADPFGRNNQYLAVVGRLPNSASGAVVQEQLDALTSSLVESFPGFYPEAISFDARPLKGDLVGDARAPLLFLLGAVGILLAVSATNAAGLYLVRGERRKGEVAVRTALGATRGRILLQHLTESVVVSVLAGAVGSVLAYLGVSVLAARGAIDLPRLAGVSVDERLIGFGLAVAVLTGLCFGLIPAVRAATGDVQSVISIGGRGGIGGARSARFRRGLVVGQVGAGATLLLGAMLMLRSLAALQSVALGVDLTGTVIVPVEPTELSVPLDQPAVRFYSEVEERLAALPGVTAVGSARRIPLADGHDRFSVHLEGRPATNVGDAPVAGIQWATDGYFRAAGLAIGDGRPFTASDDDGSPLVAVVNAALANELWPGENPIGQRLRMWLEGSPYMEVVGVAEDVRRGGPHVAAAPMLYIPHRQGHLSGYISPNNMALFVRTSGDPALLVEAIRTTLREVAPAVPVGTAMIGEDVQERALARDRFIVRLLAIFAIGALFLSAVGLYAVIAHSVRARTRELGLRVAMGASRRTLANSVLADGARMGALGGAVGLVAGALVAFRLEGSMLHVAPLDPWTYALVAPILFLVVLAASALPALSTARLDPVRAMKDDG